jgi:hypothetical protein
VIESGSKTQGVKKVRSCGDNSVDNEYFFGLKCEKMCNAYMINA